MSDVALCRVIRFRADPWLPGWALCTRGEVGGEGKRRGKWGGGVSARKGDTERASDFDFFQLRLARPIQFPSDLIPNLQFGPLSSPNRSVLGPLSVAQIDRLLGFFRFFLVRAFFWGPEWIG